MVTDKKISLRKRGSTDFANDGFRLLPVTKKEYVIGLLDADGKIDPNLMPAFLYGARQYVGMVDCTDPAGDIDAIAISSDYFGDGTSGPSDKTLQGAFVEIGTAGTIVNQTNPTEHEIVSGHPTDVTTNSTPTESEVDFPLNLEVGDWLVLVKINDSSPTYSWAVINRTYETASTANYGITKLYDGVDSTSTVLAATANAVKTVYDLADDKLSKNADALTRTTNPLTGGFEVFSDIVVANGLVTSVSTKSISPTNIQTAVFDNTMSDSSDYGWTSGKIQSQIDSAETVAKKQGLYYYSSVGDADSAGHNLGDIVAVLET